MATIAKQISLNLTEAMRQTDVKLLHSAFTSLKELADDCIVVERGKGFEVPMDLFLFACEAALSFSELDVAQECLDRLMGSPTTARSYQIRTLFCRAQMDVHKARALRGSDLIEATQAALAKVMKGIRMALQDPARLSYLVVSGSQHFWNVGRALYKERSYSDLVNSIGAIVAALEKIDHADWKTRNTWLLRHATALAGAGRCPEASAVLTKATDQVARTTPAMKYSVFRMAVALSKLVANPKVKQDAAKGVLRGVFAAQGLFCGLLDGAAAETEVIGSYNELWAEHKAELEATREKSTLTPQKAPEAKGKGAPDKGKAGAVDAATAAEEHLLREETIAELGLAMALLGHVEQATEAAAKSMQSKHLRPRVFGEYTQALLLAIECGGMRAQSEICADHCTPKMIQDLTFSVRRLERALESAVRIPDASDRNHVLQMGAVLMWNVALPLLQPSLRGSISKSLQSAVKLLDEIGSNMNYLRALLHYEASLSDVDSEYLNKAATRISTALGIDYIPDPEDAKLYSLEHPLDRFLVWMQQRVRIRSNLYEKPDIPEDEALLILEQMRDAPLLSKLSTLARVNSILLNSEPPCPPQVSEEEEKAPVAGKPGDKSKPDKAKARPTKQAAAELEEAPTDPDAEKKHVHLRNRAMLWSMLLDLAWVERSSQQVAVVQSAAEHLFCRQWPRRGDRDMQILQAKAHIALAEVHKVQLEAKQLKLSQKTFLDETEESSGSDEEEELTSQAEIDAATVQMIAEKTATVEATQKAVQAHLNKAAQLGVELCNSHWSDQWLVINAANTLWNFFIPGFEENDFVSCAKGLEAMYSALMGVNLNPQKEVSLLRDISFAYVRSLLQQYILEKQSLDTSIPNIIRVMGTDFNAFKGADANSAKLNKAVEVCEKMISLLPTPMDALPFCMISVNLRRLQGKPPDPRTNVQLKVISILGQLENVSSSNDEKRNLLTQAGELLPQDPNVELCARLAEKAIAVPGCERLAVRLSAIGQGLYDTGKLAIRQSEMPQQASTATAGKQTAKDKQAKPQSGTEQPPSQAAPATLPFPDAMCWTWYSLLMQYRGLAIVQLVNPSVQDKPTQYEVRRQALVALTNSAAAALNTLAPFRSQLILRALRHYRFISQEFGGEASARQFAYPTLRVILSDKIVSALAISQSRPAPDKESDADILAALFLVLLRCIRDSGAIDQGLKVMKQAISLLPSSHHKPFWDLDVQLRCQAGVPMSQTLLRVKEYSPETQARVWLTVARFSKEPKDQVFAYQSAIDVLHGHPVERANYYVAMAQWMLETNFDITVNGVRTIALSAVDLVSDQVDQYVPEEVMSIMDAGSLRGSVAGRSVRTQSQQMNSARSFGQGTNAASIITGVAGRKQKGPRLSVQHLATVIRAYQLLAQVSAPDAVCEGTPVDPTSCLSIFAHYVCRLWSITVAGANSYLRKQRSDHAKAEAKRAAMAQATSSAYDAHGSKRTRKLEDTHATEDAQTQGSTEEVMFTIPTMFHGWFGFRPSPLLISTLKSMHSSHAVTPGSIAAPETFISVLSDAVTRMLRERCEQFLPITLSMMKLVADVCLPAGPIQETASNLYSMMLYNVCHLSGNGALATMHHVEVPFVCVADRAALAEDAKMAARLRTSSTAQSYNETRGRIYTPQIDSRRIDHYWASMCEQLLLEGKVSSAREMLRDTMFHAEAHADSEIIARCNFVRSRIMMLEGDYNRALATLHEAQQGCPCLDIHRWTEMKIFEARLLLNLFQMDDALRLEAAYHVEIEKMFGGCTDLHAELSKMILPGLQVSFSLKFVALVLSELDKHPDSSRRIPPGNILKSLVDIVNSATDRASQLPSLHSEILLVTVELGRFELALNRHATTNELKMLYVREAAQLVHIIDIARKELPVYVGSPESKLVGVHTTRHVALAKALLALGTNIIKRVQLNSRLLSEYRNSNRTQLEIPFIDGAPQKLTTTLIAFMRSTKKQREADARQKKHASERRAIEEKREAIRRARRDEIEKTKEQRRQQEELLSPSDARGKAPGPKKAAKGPSALEPELQEISPDDKCGIDSPPWSDDDGAGEDSQSEEESEKLVGFGHAPPRDPNETVEEKQKRLALANSAEARQDVALSHVDAFVAFSEARNYLAGDSYLEPVVRCHQGYALWLLHEASLIGTEQRKSTFKGEKLPSIEHSALVESKWAVPLEAVKDAAPVDEEPAKIGRAAKARDEKKPVGKAQPAAAGAAALPSADTAQKEVPDENKLNTKPQLIVQSAVTLRECILDAHCCGNDTLLRTTLIHYASLCVAKNAMNAAARAIECAQAAQMSQYVQRLWALASYPDSYELCFLRALDEVQDCAPQFCGTAHFSVMQRTLYLQSKMLCRLRIPVTAFAFVPTTGPSTDESHPGIAPDVALLTMTVNDDDEFLYLAFRRPNGQVNIRRYPFGSKEIDELEVLTAGFEQFAQQKASILSTEGAKESASSKSTQQMDDLEAEYEAMLVRLEAFFAPFLSPFANTFGSMGPRNHLVLTIDPSFLPVPLETVSQLSKFRSVTRELSFFNVASKVARRAQEKFVPTNAAFIIDAHYESPGMVKAILGDDKPKTPAWSLLTAALDAKGFLRPLSVSLMQRALLNDKNSAAMFLSFGRMPNTISLADLCGLSLEHIRMFACLDRACNAASTRRENQTNMSKLSQIQWAESPWNVALLMLARGVDCLLANSGPISRDACQGAGRLILANLDKGAKNPAELLRRGGLADGLAKKASMHASAKPEEDAAEGLRSVLARRSDRESIVAYGISQVEEAISQSERAKR